MNYRERSAEQGPFIRDANFTVNGPVLTIHTTDSTDSAEPLLELEEKTKGEKRWYSLEERTSKTSKHWRDFLGDELCRKFLLLLDYGDLKFTLRDFPAGYYLYTDHVGTGHVFDDVRKDTYLVGGGYKFRSPQEALCHFAWLMCGQPLDRCRCVYDDKTFKGRQGSLNNAMEREWKALLDDRARQRYKNFRRTGRNELDPVVGTGYNYASFLRPEK